MVHLDYSLDNGKLLGLLLAEMTLFRLARRTYGTPSLGGDGPNIVVAQGLAAPISV